MFPNPDTSPNTMNSPSVQFHLDAIHNNGDFSNLGDHSNTSLIRRSSSAAESGVWPHQLDSPINQLAFSTPSQSRPFHYGNNLSRQALVNIARNLSADVLVKSENVHYAKILSENEGLR